jgi:hypothetical protein
MFLSKYCSRKWLSRFHSKHHFQELIQLAKDIMFHHDNSDEEDNNFLSGTISINDSIVVQPTVLFNQMINSGKSRK